MWSIISENTHLLHNGKYHFTANVQFDRFRFIQARKSAVNLTWQLYWIQPVKLQVSCALTFPIYQESDYYLMIWTREEVKTKSSQYGDELEIKITSNFVPLISHKWRMLSSVSATIRPCPGRKRSFRTKTSSSCWPVNSTPGRPNLESFIYN